jgi:poly-beta-1,6-N-acetyl-D-glucosamine synthase
MVYYLILTLFFGVAYYLLLGTYTRLWKETPSVAVANDFHSSISVVIPFRNEAKNVLALIESLNALQLGEHRLEIIFIDDHSTDGGVHIIANSGLRHSFSVLTNKGVGKKAALQWAWQNAQGDIILQTDADCVLPQNWLIAMLSPFAEAQTQLVSGPVVFSRQSGFWHSMVALDFYALISIGAAHIQWGMPMICNGANLAYRRSLLQSFDYEHNKTSGDDVFLLQYAYQKHKNGIRFCKDREATVSTAAPENFTTFWHQRIRWASKNGDYALKQNTLILAFVWLYNVLIVSSLLSFDSVGITAGIFLLVVKLLAEGTFYASFTSFFDVESKHWFKTIFYGQPFHILYMAVLPPLSQVLKYQWKDRKIAK